MMIVKKVRKPNSVGLGNLLRRARRPLVRSPRLPSDFGQRIRQPGQLCNRPKNTYE